MREGESPFEGWRHQYYSARYLEYASDAELLERADAVLGNTLAMLDCYRFEGLRANLPDEEWVRALTELRLEFALRGRIFPPSRSFVRQARPYSCSPAALHSAEAAVRGYSRPGGPVLVRYLNQRHAHSLAVGGILRLTPAISYRDHSLDAARHDDEILRWLQNGPMGVRLTHALSGRTTSFTQTISYGGSCGTDYYLVSLSRVLNPYLFFAFGVNACVVIKDPDGFFAALEEALRKELSGPWRLLRRVVDYVDPWPADPPDRGFQCSWDLHFIKDYRFAYQQEVRLVVAPEFPLLDALSPINVSLSDPSRYCDLLVLPEDAS